MLQRSTGAFGEISLFGARTSDVSARRRVQYSSLIERKEVPPLNPANKPGRARPWRKFKEPLNKN